MATVCFEVHLKASFEEWKEVFDGHKSERAKVCDESKTSVGQASEKLAIVMIYDVDMEALGKMTGDEEFQKMVEPLVEKHMVYTCSPLA